MRWHFLPVLLIAGAVHAANLVDFTNVTTGHYQVLAQSGLPMASQVNGFMNEMLRHYSRYFSNWTFKDASRVIVFENLADFRAYAQSSIGVTHFGLAGAQALLRAGQMPPVPELLAMDRATFYANPALTYPMSWALVHFLMNRDGVNYQSSHFRRYLQDLRWNRNDVESFRKRFGRDSADWEKEFQFYVARLRAPST